MNMLHRIMRHLIITRRHARRAFPAASLKSIQATIARGEQRHRAEVRLVIEPALSLRDALAGMSARQRARELFAFHHIWDTEENCGILVYVNLADHRVELIADRGVQRLLHADQWQAVCQTMADGFARHDHPGAVNAALDQLGDMLALCLPATGARPNELSNAPLMI
ncbi:MAG: TPM domain-containing protein [Janthinobacterium lividum]